MPVERTTPQLVKKGKVKKDLGIVDRVDIKVAEVVVVEVEDQVVLQAVVQHLWEVEEIFLEDHPAQIEKKELCLVAKVQKELLEI